MKIIMDAYAWIEYLDGTKKGLKVKEFLMQPNEIYTSSFTIAEVISRSKRQEKNTDLVYQALSINSKIIQITPKIARDAGLFHAEMHKKIRDFGLIDSLLLVLARRLNAKILTGDKHFKQFKEAIFLD